jgi:hypothetical protein
MTMNIPWPREVQQMLDDAKVTPVLEQILDRLGEQLGESQEAWRGANTVAEMVLGMLGSVAEMINRHDGALDPYALDEKLNTLIATLLVGLTMHPMVAALPGHQPPRWE